MLTPLISADFQNYQLCGGDLETQMLCFGDAQTGGVFFPSQDLNITIINPDEGSDEKANPVNFLIETNNLANCNISIDGGSNLSMSGSETYLHEYTKTLSNGFHTSEFYCEDILTNLASNNLDFYVYISSSGSVFSPTKKYFINLDSSKEWYYDVTNKIDIKIYDEIAQITPISNLDYEIIEPSNITYNDLRFNLSLVEEGKYLGELQVINRNITNVTIEFKADKNGEMFYENITRQVVTLIEKSFFEKNKKLILIIFCLLLLLLLLLLFILWKRRKDKKSNKL